jgi:tellurite methyltransferase
MRRPITGYHDDAKGDPIAELSCGHGQHVRHQPPLFSRPWVLSDEGRRSMLGTELDCVRCDRRELPEGFVPYRRTPDFDETTIPAALQRSHTTKPGVWAVIHVASGVLRYVIEPEPRHEVRLEGPATAVVVPEVPHHVEPASAVRFFLELHRAPPR